MIATAPTSTTAVIVGATIADVFIAFRAERAMIARIWRTIVTTEKTPNETTLRALAEGQFKMTIMKFESGDFTGLTAADFRKLHTHYQIKAAEAERLWIENDDGIAD